jgi:hypothetical protein
LLIRIGPLFFIVESNVGKPTINHPHWLACAEPTWEEKNDAGPFPYLLLGVNGNPTTNSYRSMGDQKPEISERIREFTTFFLTKWGHLGPKIGHLRDAPKS